MFQTEIMQQNTVEIYDCHLQRIMNGRITGYNDQKQYLVINEKIVFPLRHVAKIEVIKKQDVLRANDS